MIFFLQYVCIHVVLAASLSAIVVTMNCATQAKIVIDCNVIPIYMIFYLHNPERIVIDFLQGYNILNNILPVTFNNNSLIRCVRTSAPVIPQSVRIVIDLADVSTIETVTQKKVKKIYRLMFTICKQTFSFLPPANIQIDKKSSVLRSTKCVTYVTDSSVSNKKKKKIDIKKNVLFNNKSSQRNNAVSKNSSLIIVAIDAGHGGQDPGATGYNGIYEKDITISIAKKLKRLLDLDPMFSAVMIRNGDYFLSIMDRSNIARKNRANVLVSIHTDSVINTNVRGASVWILSNSRARSEITYLLSRSERCSELLGGLGEILTSYRHDPYFNYFILDLQFGYSQKVGYNIAMHFLKKLKDVSVLHKNFPEYSGFGVLRALDIPSILVETGFISNKREMDLLSNSKYQEKIADALYQGLRAYFVEKSAQKCMDGYSHGSNTCCVSCS